MLTILAALAAALAATSCLLLWSMRGIMGGATDLSDEKLTALSEAMRDEFARNRKESSEQAQAQREEQRTSQDAFEKKMEENAKQQTAALRVQFGDLVKQLDTQNKQALEALKDVRGAVEQQLKDIREDNGKRLEEMRKTVDEKLQDTLEKRLGESFKIVSERLEQVHKGLGEMQNLASGVGDLKKVLTNVKTKGILGEYQLANIIEQLLRLNNTKRTSRPAQAAANALSLPFACQETPRTMWFGCPLTPNFRCRVMKICLTLGKREIWKAFQQQRRP
jgi:DNA recombination protein RmuC